MKPGNRPFPLPFSAVLFFVISLSGCAESELSLSENGTSDTDLVELPPNSARPIRLQAAEAASSLYGMVELDVLETTLMTMRLSHPKYGTLDLRNHPYSHPLIQPKERLVVWGYRIGGNYDVGFGDAFRRDTFQVVAWGGEQNADRIWLDPTPLELSSNDRVRIAVETNDPTWTVVVLSGNGNRSLPEVPLVMKIGPGLLPTEISSADGVEAWAARVATWEWRSKETFLEPGTLAIESMNWFYESPIGAEFRTVGRGGIVSDQGCQAAFENSQDGITTPVGTRSGGSGLMWHRIENETEIAFCSYISIQGAGPRQPVEFFTRYLVIPGVYL